MKYVVDYHSLKSIANAIRSRAGTSALMLLSEMPSAINAIPQTAPGTNINISDTSVSADSAVGNETITVPYNFGGISNVSA